MILAKCVAQDLRIKIGIVTIFKRKFKRFEDLRSQEPEIGRSLCLSGKKCHLFCSVANENSIGKLTSCTKWNSLISLGEQLLELGMIKIRMPKLGCGLDGLDWGIAKITEKNVKICSFSNTSKL